MGKYLSIWLERWLVVESERHTRQSAIEKVCSFHFLIRFYELLSFIKKIYTTRNEMLCVFFSPLTALTKVVRSQPIQLNCWISPTHFLLCCFIEERKKLFSIDFDIKSASWFIHCWFVSCRKILCIHIVVVSLCHHELDGKGNKWMASTGTEKDSRLINKS